ncbi:glycosyltransferase [Flavobacterium sp. FZUC8N2.13]|uniref:Glycosyltransferase n=1 Tax=Flavobacterium zubiriense TaxID=3138075 RepID=A0ABV4TEX8_9FLAO
MIDNLKNTQKNMFNKKALSNQDASQHYDMIVFCHLRWQFVYQRPQHIISRMAKTMKILFVEEPLHYNENENSGNLIIINEMLHVLQPNVKDIQSIAAIIPKYVSNKIISLGWFYSAAFCPILESIHFENVVYDCMDELSLFKNAPMHLINQEKYLMSQANIIFTGGKSLYESKKRFHKNVHCFPSSVDEYHFSQALNGIAIPNDIAKLKSPIVGYYGVIDERINLQLLHEVAKKLPGVCFVMIGPLAKIEESDLPRESNIHYFGMKSYDELPHYLKAFDIAMMPFALNDATKYISPTKTLEYMAAGKPIISTKIIDVVRDYSICVSLIETADDFSDAVVSLLDKTDRLSMEIEYNKILEKTSWDVTAEKMKLIIKTFAK